MIFMLGCTVCVPVWRILYHVIVSCKGSIRSHYADYMLPAMLSLEARTVELLVTRIIFLFFASLRENLFVFLFPLFCDYLSFLVLRNTPLDYATTPSIFIH